MDVFSVRPDAMPDPDRQWLRIEHEHDGTTTRLTVAGELDGPAAPQMSRAVEHVLSQYTPATLDVDVEGVTFLDSSGIRCLLVCLRHAESAGCALSLVNVPPAVNEVLRITGLLKTFGLAEPHENPVSLDWRYPHTTR